MNPTVITRETWLGKLGTWFVPIPETGCWIWMRTMDITTGYGRFYDMGKRRMAHRAAFEAVRGPIPDGLTIDHLCRERMCVNPDHLEPCTRGENTMRGRTISAANLAKTHCKRGHEFTTDNTRFYGKHNNGRRRHCKECSRIKAAQWRADNPEKYREVKRRYEAKRGKTP